MLTADNAAGPLIDHQAELILFSQDIDPLRLRKTSIGLAKVLKLHNIPVMLTAVDHGTTGPIRPILPEETNLLPDLQPIY